MIPTQVTYRGMQRSAALEQEVADRIDKLGRSGEKILSCKVSIEATAPYAKGHVFNVHAKAMTAHGEVMVSSDDDRKGNHDDAYVAVRHAIDTLLRRVQESRDRRRSLRLHHRAAS